MAPKPRENPDMYLLSVMVLAYRGAGPSATLLEMAYDDPARDGAITMAQAEYYLRRSGLMVATYAYPEEYPPQMFWAQARTGRWCAGTLLCPCGCLRQCWGLLDACADHEPRALWWRHTGQQPCSVASAEAHWLGQMIVCKQRCPYTTRGGQAATTN